MRNIIDSPRSVCFVPFLARDDGLVAELWKRKE